MNKNTSQTTISESVGLRVILVELTSARKKMRAYHSSVIPFTFRFKVYMTTTTTSNKLKKHNPKATKCIKYLWFD